MPDSDGIRQNHQLKYEAPPPSPVPQAELLTYPKFTPFLSISSHFKTIVKVTPQLVCAKELSGDGIDQKRFCLKGKAYGVFF